MLIEHLFDFELNATMLTLIDLENYPTGQPYSDAYRSLVDRCQKDLERAGMFNLEGFPRPHACRAAVDKIQPVMAIDSYTHRRRHNVYFLDAVLGLEPNHSALVQVETVNHTVCADQIENSAVIKVYEYPPLIQFLANTMNKTMLYLMDDPLARINVMSYRENEALNWHFDRSEFTTTLLLQAPKGAGEFQYRTGLRTDHDPNYDGVARLLDGDDPKMKTLRLKAGTLSVFRGKNTAHRITPVVGSRERMIAVFSYYEHPGKFFSEEEQLGFYGRTM
ncbi:MAG: hypothetical protein WBM41_08175 [Arenicellales bacterium]